MTGYRDEPFVGRTMELAAINEALSHAPGRTRLVCVSGPAGIGKTSLAATATSQERAETGGAEWTRCWNGPGTPALWPWRQLFSELGIAESIEIDVASSADNRFIQFDRMCGELCRLSLQRPLTVIIDDIHWADRASLQLLHFIARDTRQSALRVIATYRDGEAEASDNASVVADIEREADSIRLSGLRNDAIQAIARELGIESSDTVRSVAERTGGNPFFATELLHQLVDREQADELVPTSIRSLIEGQLELIDPDSRTTLELAAVQGQAFSTEILAIATGIDPFDLDAMLRHAQRSRLVVHRDGEWAFVHALIGETLIDGLGSHQLAQHHLATADAIDQLSGRNDPEHIESLANHLSAAGSLVDVDRLVAVSLTAATVAQRQLAFESESALLGRAIDVVRATGDRRLMLLDALTRRVVAEKALGNFETANTLGLEAAEVARAIGDHVGLGRVALVFPPDTEGVELDQTFNPDQTRLREEALSKLPAEHAALRSQLQAAHAMSLYWTESPADTERYRHAADQRDALTADALATAEELGDDHTLAVALHARIYANWGPATDSGRLDLALRLVDAADRLGDVRLALTGRVWRIVDHLENGRLVEAEVELDSFEADAIRIRDRYQRWSAMRIRSNIASMRGDVAATESLAREALAYGSTFLPNDAAFAFFSAMLGPIAFLRGTLGATADFVREMANQNPHVPAWRIGYAAAAVDAGDLATARNELDGIAANDFAMLPRDLDFLTSLATAVSATRATGHVEAARSAIDHALPYSGKFIIHGIGYAHYGCFDLLIAECAEVLGDFEMAVDHYERAIDQLDAVGSRYRAFTRLLLGRLLATSRPEVARRHLVDARTQYESFGAERMIERVDAALASTTSIHTIRLIEDPDGWRLVRHGTDDVALPAWKGFRALQELVTNPNESRHALVLASLIEGHGGANVGAEVHTELADDAALTSYRSRIVELDEALDAADRAGDSTRSGQLQDELDAITDELSRASGFGGRRATSSGSADRARVNVTKHIKRSIARIGESDAALADELRQQITTGMHCSFQPPPSSTTIWSR